MKHILFAILSSFVLLSMVACCTKKDCSNEGDIYEIELYNFKNKNMDVDTIIIYSYFKDTNFSTPLDSMISFYETNTRDYCTASIEKLNFGHDYKIVLLSTGQVVNLSGFETEKLACNTCFPYRPESEYYTRLKKYLLNGQIKLGDRIKIYN